MPRLAVFMLLCAVLVSTPVSAQHLRFGRIQVYTRNLYIGTDFSPVFAALQNPSLPPSAVAQAASAAFGEIASTNFLQRAEALAKEIEAIAPHLIGLQEVFNFTQGGVNSVPPFVDALETLLAKLNTRRLQYRVAAVVNNLDLTFSAALFSSAGGGDIRVLSRDVILARHDVHTTVAVFPCATHQRPTPADGCNYGTLLPLVLPAPVPPSALFRGFVGVDAIVNGETYRFVTTHLEVQAVGTAIQQAQARELVDTIRGATPPERPVILVGDFNSAPTDLPGSAYDIIRAAAYADTWQRNLFRSLNPGGFTCCQASALTNDTALLNERIDLIFVKNQPD